TYWEVFHKEWEPLPQVCEKDCCPHEEPCVHYNGMCLLEL
ncbi:unnamed protein product, partial [marine sediment metagenome]